MLIVNISSYEFWINLIVWICTIILIGAVIYDFILFEDKNNTKNTLKSKVATWRMSIFFVLIYLALRFNIWTYYFEDFQIYFIVIWLIIVIFSTYFNVLWRFYLSTNWGNNIKIYDDHTLITSWPYKIVRHPLYASLLWLTYWVALIYSNFTVFILWTFVYLPMMIYRAKQEEKLLSENFKDYSNYKKRVWMFFPKFFNKW
jgi:protein-S-isoprenylcysteine O-methyltransferase Ste14